MCKKDFKKNFTIDCEELKLKENNENCIFFYLLFFINFL